ncbi:hypothetical protein Tco_0356238 [Tanacetum coccineum]
MLLMRISLNFYVPAFDVEDFSSWKDKFLVYLDGLEPYLVEILENGPFIPKDTKIAALRLKFNAFKALDGEKFQGTFTRLKILLNDLENKGVFIPQAEVNATFVNSLPRKWLKDTRSSSEFRANLNVEFHDRALLANQKRFYKRSGRVGSAKKTMDKSKQTCFAHCKQENEGVTRVKAFMAIAEDEPSVGKINARSDCHEITSDSESEFDNEDSLPPLPKLSGAKPIGTPTDFISLADLTQTSKTSYAVSEKTNPIANKESRIKVTKKKTQTKSPSILIRKLTHPLSLVKEVKGLKEQIKPPSDNSS